MASASYDDTVKLYREVADDWSVETMVISHVHLTVCRECFDTLTGHASTVWAIDFDASGNHLGSPHVTKT